MNEIKKYCPSIFLKSERYKFKGLPYSRLHTLKFIHITKCAGTSIEEAAKEVGINWGKYHREYNLSQDDGFWHIPFQQVSEEIKKKYDWFVVVRNPYDRILSEYYCGAGGNGKNVTHSVEMFNKLTIKNILERENHPYTGHFLEQYKYIDDSIKIHILKYENLQTEIDNLMRLYNLKNIILEKKNSRTENNINDKLFTVKDFSEELIKTINLVYNKDFEMFHYAKI